MLREHIILDRDPYEAVQHLLRLPALRKFLASLKDEKDQEQFKRHLRRYALIYMPDSPFEVTTTNRYTITEHEASITARRDIKPREEVKYLTGVQVAMTEEQEKNLELLRKDFSLVISSRKKTRSLFLGPARFANHDCDPNAKLSTTGYDGMQIVAVKAIECGEEITVSYGEDYFGEDNEECLCRTCETRGVNGWAPFKRVEDSDDEEDDDEKPAAKEQTPQPDEGSYSFRRKRKYDSTQEDTSRDSTPPTKRSKTEPKGKLLSPSKRSVSGSLRGTGLKKPYSPSALRQELPISSIEYPTTNLVPSSQVLRDFRTQQRVGLLNVTLDETSSSRDTTPQSSMAAASPKSSQSTDATSVDEDHPMTGTNPKIKVDPETIHAKPTLGVATIKDEITSIITPASALFADDTTSELSELSDGEDFDDELLEIVKHKRPKATITRRTTRSRSRNEVQNRVGTPIPDYTTEEGWEENERKPGDYMTSKSVLSAKGSKWSECQTCEEEFVQTDGFRGTRKECPRCERHSKLYGFAWPKTDKEGKYDKEERVLDHRTIHRFVDPEEEKELKKAGQKRKLRESIVQRFSTPRSGRESSMSVSMDPESGRKRRRVRKTM